MPVVAMTVTPHASDAMVAIPFWLEMFAVVAASISGVLVAREHKLDLVDAMVLAADPNASDEQVAAVERSACPTCGSCSGMFTANSMNCLTEALGLSLPGNGTVLATHADREQLFLRAPCRAASPPLMRSRTR